MKLLLDAGNTRLKWGLFQNDHWYAQGILDYDSLDALPTLWPAGDTPADAWIANVAGPSIGDALQTLLARHAVPAHFLRASAMCCGVVNHYRNPSQLGADRWAALIGARSMHKGAALVVCAGTATTIDVLDADGHFQGGLILPGFDLMRRSLAHATAGLPIAQAGGVSDTPPVSTDEAISEGCLAAQLGAVRHMWRYVVSQPGSLCIVSGGAAEQLLCRLDLPSREVPNLVLEGLARMAGDTSI